MKMSFQQHKKVYGRYGEGVDVIKDLKEKFKNSFKAGVHEEVKQYFQEKHKFISVPYPSLVYQLAEFYPDELDRIFKLRQLQGRSAYHDCTYRKDYSWSEDGIVSMLDDVEEEIFILVDTYHDQKFLLVVHSSKRKVDLNDDMLDDGEREMVYFHNAEYIETITFDLTLESKDYHFLNYLNCVLEPYAKWSDFELNVSRHHNLKELCHNVIDNTDKIISMIDNATQPREYKTETEKRFVTELLVKQKAVANRVINMYDSGRVLTLATIKELCRFDMRFMECSILERVNHYDLFMAQMNTINQLATKFGVQS